MYYVNREPMWALLDDVVLTCFGIGANRNMIVFKKKTCIISISSFSLCLVRVEVLLLHFIVRKGRAY